MMTSDKVVANSIWRLNLKNICSMGKRRGGVHVIIVSAADEGKARLMASNCVKGRHDEESPQPAYLDPNLTDCVLLGHALPAGKEMILAVDYDYDYDHVTYPWAQ